jgi:homoserine kinase
MRERVTVSAPASSANLGPGYDCLGVALPLRLTVTAERRPGPLAVQVDGEGAGRLPSDASNLVAQAFVRGGGPDEGVQLTAHSPVPLASGLGSSSAAIVAGLAAARALAGRDVDPPALLGPATALEGHPDNVAAALLGGFTLALTNPPGARRIDPPAGLAFITLTPAEGLSTHESRAALRPAVDRADAVHTLARAALLVSALHRGALEDLPLALDDRLHEPDRAPLVPLLGRVRGEAARLGALGTTLSGAGPSVLVWARSADADALRRALADAHPEAAVRLLAPEPEGVRVEDAS